MEASSKSSDKSIGLPKPTRKFSSPTTKVAGRALPPTYRQPAFGTRPLSACRRTALPDRTVRAFLIWVDGPLVLEIDAGVLDAALSEAIG